LETAQPLAAFDRHRTDRSGDDSLDKKKIDRVDVPGELTDLMFKTGTKEALIKQGLFALAILFLILGWPDRNGQEDEVPDKRIDVVIAIDVSKSRLVQDLTPNRLENSKSSLNLIIDEWPATHRPGGFAERVLSIVLDHGIERSKYFSNHDSESFRSGNDIELRSGMY
jgi:hypothetical protein